MNTNKQIYLDHAAATPVDGRVVEAMQPFWAGSFYNPSSIYLASRSSKQSLELARVSVAHWLGSRPSEVVFTAGATEANNIALAGVSAKYPNSKIIISCIEHDAVREPAKQFASVGLIPVDERGVVKLTSLKAAIDDQTSLVSIIIANNEIGTVQKLSEIASIIVSVREDRKNRGVELPLYLHTDASQAANFLDLHVNRLGVDLMTLNGAKTYGPKQSGILYQRAGVILEPTVRGGGQERGLRSGTENVAVAVGFAKALDIAQKMRRAEQPRLLTLRTKFIIGIKDLSEDIVVHGHKKQTLPSMVSIMIPGIDGERAVMQLDELGVMCATGSACSAQKDDSSHVIQALGYTPVEAGSTLRFSMGRSTSIQDIESTVVALRAVLASKNVWL